ncbi:MAG: ankyrin repeat domain-containing protein [Epsilonproteobacteria bacterium]|nr:ankyrin repeat domain-containing protein [Campylobacterota bacterium]
MPSRSRLPKMPQGVKLQAPKVEVPKFKVPLPLVREAACTRQQPVLTKPLFPVVQSKQQVATKLDTPSVTKRFFAACGIRQPLFDTRPHIQTRSFSSWKSIFADIFGLSGKVNQAQQNEPKGKSAKRKIKIEDATQSAEWRASIQEQLNAQDMYGRTPLMIAVENKDYGQVQSLLAQGANVNIAANDGVSPLMLAITSAEYDLVKLLIAHGADVNATDKRGQTPADHLMVAYTIFKIARGGFSQTYEKIYALLRDAGARDSDKFFNCKKREKRTARATGYDHSLEVLGFEHGVKPTSGDIKKAYYRLAKRHHPDAPGGSEDMFKKVRAAYEHLKGGYQEPV